MSSPGNSCNLVADPWIPVLGSDGVPTRVGMAQLLEQAGSIRAFTGPPPIRIAVLRLVCAIVRDALGHGEVPEARWNRWWESATLPVNEATGYLERHADRFDLFDPRRPFLQDGTMNADRTAIRSVAELAPHLPTGNNSTLIHRTTDLDGPNPACFTAADAACWLVSMQAHTRPGITASRNAAPPGRASGRAGLLLGRLAAVPEGPTIALTVLLNLPRAARDPLDVPTYLAPQAVRPGTQACGPVSLMTWAARHVLLLPEGGAVRAAKIAVDPDIDPLVSREIQAAHDPHLLVRASDRATDGWTLEPAKAGRTPLRDAALIIRHVAAATTASVLPAAAARKGRPVRLCVYGLAVESTAKYTDWTVSSIPWADHSSVVEAAEVAQAAANAAGAAAAALARAGDKATAPASAFALALRTRAATAVWQQLDGPGRELLARLTDRPASAAELDRWRGQCSRAARAAVYAVESPYADAPARARADSLLERELASLERETASAAQAPSTSRGARNGD